MGDYAVNLSATSDETSSTIPPQTVARWAALAAERAAVAFLPRQALSA